MKLYRSARISGNPEKENTDYTLRYVCNAMDMLYSRIANDEWKARDDDGDEYLTNKFGDVFHVGEWRNK